MPYSTNSALPDSVRHHLPAGAQTLYREAFNGAWRQYASSDRREEIAHRVAWAAVKRQYHKEDDMWAPSARVPKSRTSRARRG